MSLYLAEPLQRIAVFQGEGFVYAAGKAAYRVRQGLVCRGAELTYLLPHMTAGKEGGVIRVDYGAEGLRRLRLTNYFVPAQGYSLRLPFAPAFLDKPQPHYILQRAEAALHGALVGEARIPHLVGEQRKIRFYAENRPCAAGTEGKA